MGICLLAWVHLAFPGGCTQSLGKETSDTPGHSSIKGDRSAFSVGSAQRFGCDSVYAHALPQGDQGQEPPLGVMGDEPGRVGKPRSPSYTGVSQSQNAERRKSRGQGRANVLATRSHYREADKWTYARFLPVPIAALKKGIHGCVTRENSIGAHPSIENGVRSLRMLYVRISVDFVNDSFTARHGRPIAMDPLGLLQGYHRSKLEVAQN